MSAGPVYIITQDPKKILLMLESVIGFPNNIVLESSLLLMLPFCVNESLEWIMYYKSVLVMIFVYLLYGTECVLHCALLLMVCMDLSMMGMCHPFAQIYKLAGLMCYIKAFRLNSLSPQKTSMLKHLDLYMLLTVFNYLMILSVLFEVQFSDVRKVILDDFVWRKVILFI